MILIFLNRRGAEYAEVLLMSVGAALAANCQCSRLKPLLRIIIKNAMHYD